MFWFPFLGAIVLDRISKIGAQSILEGAHISVWGEYVQFIPAYNSGIAFGIQLPFLGVITGGVIGLLAWYYLRYERPHANWLVHTAFGCILGGACANAYDRWIYGEVYDFIFVKHFAIFNVADIVINVGVILMCLHLIREGSSRTS